MKYFFKYFTEGWDALGELEYMDWVEYKEDLEQRKIPNIDKLIEVMVEILKDNFGFPEGYNPFDSDDSDFSV